MIITLFFLLGSGTDNTTVSFVGAGDADDEDEVG